jgi:hypothetical protein
MTTFKLLFPNLLASLPRIEFHTAAVAALVSLLLALLALAVGQTGYMTVFAAIFGAMVLLATSAHGDIDAWPMDGMVG